MHPPLRLFPGKPRAQRRERHPAKGLLHRPKERLQRRMLRWRMLRWLRFAAHKLYYTGRLPVCQYILPIFFAIFLQKPRKNAVFPVDSVKKAGFALKSSGFLLYAHLYAGHALRFFDIASCYNQRDENGNMWKFEKGRERSSADMTKARAGVCWPRRCARARSFLRHTPRGACSRAERGRALAAQGPLRAQKAGA